MLPAIQECLRASSLLKLLLRAPFILGDDARYQRVLEFLVQATCSADTKCFISEQEFIEFACQGVDYEKHAHFRLLALTIRLIASWINTRQKDFFQKLLIQHPTVILTTVENISHSDALVRMTCIEAWNELIVANEWAQSWFASSHKGPYFVAHTLEDSSTCVMIDGCQFLTKILIAPSNLSLDVIREQIVNELDLLDALSCYLYDEGEDGDAQALVALEFLWTINQTKSPKAYLFLLESQLLFRYKKLLLHPSKMVRTKIMDILEQGIRWWPEPHSVLGIETCFVTTFDNISANTFLFGKEILAGLKGEHDAIDWYDAARLAMLACRYYQPVSGSEDLWQCFYTVFWRSLSINISDTNETSNGAVFSGLKSYKSWLSTVVSHLSDRQPALGEQRCIDWALAKSSAIICQQWIMEFTIPHEKLKAALNCFINTAVKSFDLDQYQTTQIITRSIAAHIEKIGLTDTLNYSLNKLLNKLLGVQAINHQKLLCGLQCTFQLYKHPSILLPYVDCRVVALCALVGHKHADIREMSLRVVKNILNGMTEQHAKAITVGTWQNIEQALTTALSDDETAVILASMDIVKTYTVLHYQLHGHTWSLVKTLLPLLLKHHEPSVRRLALSTTISIWHNESLTADQNSILTVITTNDIELLIGDDEWETRLMTCHLLEQLWQAASNTTPSIHQLLFYRWAADQWLLQAVTDNTLSVRREAIRILHQIARQINDAEQETIVDLNSDQSIKAVKKRRLPIDNDNKDEDSVGYNALKNRLLELNWARLEDATISLSDTSLLLEELGLTSTNEDDWMPAAPLVDDCF